MNDNEEQFVNLKDLKKDFKYFKKKNIWNKIVIIFFQI